MARDSAGTYVLPTSNPVVTLTTIASGWANTTLADIASALTDSLDRQGRGAMQAPLKLAAGSAGAPALSWDAETTAGWYRAAAADFRFGIGGTQVAGITAEGLVQRDGSGNFYRAGFREIPPIRTSAALTITSAHAAKLLIHPSSDATARIWTLQADSTSNYEPGTAITIWNQNGAGALTITSDGNTLRRIGDGATGSRTLAANGMVTLLWDENSNEWAITGTGLT